MNHRIGCALVGAMLLSAVSSDAFAAEAKAEASKGQTANAAGMRVYLDPETGEMVDRPVTAEQRAAAASDAELFRQDNEGPREVRHPDGSVSKDLEGRFELATQVHKTADGLLKYTCNDAAHVEQGKHAHAQQAPVSSARDVR